MARGTQTQQKLPLHSIRIREYRADYGLSGASLADAIDQEAYNCAGRPTTWTRLGVDRRSVSRWENGVLPGKRYQDLLCAVFGSAPYELGFRRQLPGERAEQAGEQRAEDPAPEQAQSAQPPGTSLPTAWLGAARRLADVMRTGVKHHWSMLEPVDRLEMLENLLYVGAALDTTSDAAWRGPVTTCASEVAELRLGIGDPARAEHVAQQVRERHPPASEEAQGALAVLCELAHVRGRPDQEDALLAAWEAAPATARPLRAFILEARREIRGGRAAGALTCLRVALSRPDFSLVERTWLRVEEARACCYGGDAHDGLAIVIELEETTGSIVATDMELSVAVDHAAYMALHNLERNADAVARSERCLTAYRRAGMREGALLSLVNLGDAAWGIGDVVRAHRLLARARREAGEVGYAHATNLALICWANVAAERNPVAARAAYVEGVRLARNAGWEWDELYGRTYLALLDAEREQGAGRALEEIADAATGRGFRYLAALAGSYVLMLAARRRRPLDERLVGEVLDAGVPAPRAYALAAQVLSRPDREPPEAAARALIAELAAMQGAKGRPRFLLAAARRAARDSAERAVVERFSARVPAAAPGGAR